MNWEARLEAARVLRKAALAKRKLEQNAAETSEERPITAEIFQNTGLERRVDSEAGTEERQSETPRAQNALSGAERLEEALARRKEVLSQKLVDQDASETADARIFGSDSCQESKHESINHDRSNLSTLGAKDTPTLRPLRVEPASFSDSVRTPEDGFVATNHRVNGFTSRLALGTGIGFGIGMSIILGVSILDTGPELPTIKDSVLTVGVPHAISQASFQETNVLNSITKGHSVALLSSEEKAPLPLGPEVKSWNPPPMSQTVIPSNRIELPQMLQPGVNVVQPVPILQSPAVHDSEPISQVMSPRLSYLKKSRELALQASGKEVPLPRPMEPTNSVNPFRAVPLLDLEFASETESDIASLAVAVPLALPDTRISGVDAYKAVINAPSTLDEEEVNLVAADVRETGMSLGRINRVNYKVSTNQVRFFHQDDAELALALAQHIGAQARDFTNYRPSPPAKSIEIFLTGNGKPVARRTPHRTKFVSDAIRLRNKIVRTLGIPER